MTVTNENRKLFYEVLIEHHNMMKEIKREEKKVKERQPYLDEIARQCLAMLSPADICNMRQK